MLNVIVVILALIWLMVRLYKFLAIPVGSMVHSLKIKTPTSTKVSIDKISTKSITIHWENEPSHDKNKLLKKPDSIVQYILYINNLQMSVFPNSSQSLYTCCSITNLKPGTTYQLDFITVNNMGFISKLPSIFVTTRRETDNDNIIKNRKWRRNTVSSPNTNTNTNITTPITSGETNLNNNVSSNDDMIPSYSNLTNIKDLDTYSIEDLKKILICAQEDLHDVLTQQTSYLEDFQDSKQELILELDNLKNHWSHELDFRKSLKSNIKSLENNKLLSDMKYEKLNQKIVKTKDKIKKMETDILNWGQNELVDLDKEKLNIKYNLLNVELNKSIKFLELKISNLQNETGKLEKENKELNFMKKSSSSTNLSNLASNVTALRQPQQQIVSTAPTSSSLSDDSIKMTTILKKMNAYVSKDTGLLTSQGQEYLSTLNDENQLVKLIKEQITIDSQNNDYWNKKKHDLLKKINDLNIKFDKIDLSNRQLRAQLIAQPYNNELNETNQQTNQQLHFIQPKMSSYGNQQLSNSNSNSLVNLAALNSNQSNNTNNNIQPLLQQQQQSNYIPASTPMVKQTSLLQSQIQSQPLLNDSTTTTTTTTTNNNNNNIPSFPPINISSTTTAMANVNASAHNQLSPQSNYDSWRMTNSNLDLNQSSHIHNNNNNNNNNTHSNEIIDQNFDYDNANHLITGLQDMIYDETDYPEKISNYSKGFTTDQLDNYWTSQRDNHPINMTSNVEPIKINTTEDGKPYPIFRSDLQMNTPMTSHTHEFGTPLSKSPFIPLSNQQNQSLLAATLNDSNSMSPFVNDSTFSSRNNESGNFYRQQSQMDSQNTNTNNLTSVFNNANNKTNNNAINNPDQLNSPFVQSLTPQNSNILSSPPQQTQPQQHMNYMNIDPHQIQSSVMEGENKDYIERSKSPSDGLFQSPSFNFLWHNQPNKNDLHNNNNNNNHESLNDKKKSNDNHSHKRNKSDGSNMSTWTNRLSLRSKAISSSSQGSSIHETIENDNNSSADKETNSQSGNGNSTNQPSSSSIGSSGRKMSRLLSRSTVNDIFKLRNHDNNNNNHS